MGEAPGVMPRAKLASLVPDPDFWGHFEGLGGGSDTKGSLALLQPVSQSIPALTVGQVAADRFICKNCGMGGK